MAERSHRRWSCTRSLPTEEMAIDTFIELNPLVNPLSVKGMGEHGMVGSPAAIANALFHATGRRVLDLPITPDKLLSIDGD